MAVALLLSACGTGGSVAGKSADKQNGAKIFSDKCAGCHTLAAASSSGTIGPNLDASFAEARSEGFKESAILDIVHDQIKFPGQYPVSQNDPNYLKANMPANLVTGQDAIDVAAYVASVAGQGGFTSSESFASFSTDGAKIFKGAGCAGCHTLAAAGSTGTTGPNPDQLAPTTAVVAHQVEVGGGLMPAFKGKLSDAQIQAVAQYVSSSAGKK